MFKPYALCKFIIAVLFALLLATISGVGFAQYMSSDEYQWISYDQDAVDNPVARLLAKLESGEQRLEYKGHRGYLEDLLDKLEISPSSQLLVYSATSLQNKLISPKTPRALYFSDDIYIGWVQHSNIVEVTTIDEKLGIVFYTFDNTDGTSRYFERSNQACLVCHDTQGTMGGGVPMLMALSAVYNVSNVPVKNFSGIGNITDTSPIENRWGGWYVTGQHGTQKHLGNIFVKQEEELDRLDSIRVSNLESLTDAGYFDVSPYLRSTSDIVSLMVLEHQLTVQNQITYIKFKAPAVLRRRGLDDVSNAPSWQAMPENAQQALTRMMDRFVASLLFLDAVPLKDRFAGNPEFEDWFQQQGVFDHEGRSLRQLDLETRLFSYPVSYLLYTDDFDSLPVFARDYVYREIAAYLQGEKSHEGRQQFTDAERREALEILAATKAEFRDYLDSGLDNKADAKLDSLQAAGNWQ